MLINKWLGWSLEVVGLVMLAWGIQVWKTKDLLAEGTVAPWFELTALDGQIYRLEAKQATLLYFFAPWCTICHFNIRNLEKLRRVRPSEELSIFLIALSWNEVKEVNQFVAKHNLTLPVLLGTAEVAKAYHIKGFPTYYILNKEHQIIKKSVGYSTEWGLRWNTQ